MIKDYLKLMRVNHYLKNLLIFLPLLFSRKMLEWVSLKSSLFAFISFSLIASAVYITNDICDKDIDQLHDLKKHRPIAAQKVSVKKAIFLIFFLIIMAITFNYLATRELIGYSYLYIITYMILNIAYSFGLKNIPLVDITILVSGFLIRVLYGATVIGVSVSNWLYLTIISMSFYLGLGKRRNEIKKEKTKTRAVLQYYSSEFLDRNMYVCLAITIVFYALWCVDPTTIVKTSNYIIWTVPLIILICMRYSMIVEGDSYGDPVDVVLADKVLLGLIVIYSLIMVIAIYC